MHRIVGLALFAIVLQTTIPNGVNAFSPASIVPSRTVRSWSLLMVGGRGYDNSDYLDNLDGDEDAASQEYEKFQQRREAFLEKQAELMKTEQGRKFLEMRQKLADKEAGELGGQSQSWTPGANPENLVDQDGGFGDLGEDAMSSGGGSRMRNMMRNAAGANKMAPQGMFGSFGLVGMDEDSEGEDKCNDDREME